VLTIDERLRIHNGGDAIRIKVVIDRRPTLRIERAGRRLSPSPGPTQPEQKLSAAFSSPRPPEKCDSDDQDHRAGKREVSPRLPLAPRRLSNKIVRMFSRHDRRPPSRRFIARI
jgi:hypothetical protein